MGSKFFFTPFFMASMVISAYSQNFQNSAKAPIEVSGNEHTRTIQAQYLWPGAGLGLNLSGAGYTIYQWEASLGNSSHPDTNNTYLLGRVSFGDNSNGFSSHATTMAQIMIGQGGDSSLHGIAYQASIKAFGLNNFKQNLRQNGGLIKQSVHAYASNNGWSYNSAVSGRFWYGLEEISTTEDYNFGYYNDDARFADSILYNYPYLISVKSAGNDRGESYSGKHYFYKSVGGSTTNYVIDSSFATRIDDGGSNGYDCLSSSSCSKNNIVIGAADTLPNGWASTDDVVIRPGSGYGPTDDGRIKPDLVAGGDKTSHSAAAAAGSCVLLAQHFKNTTGRDPLSSTIKGLLIHTADEAGSFDGPDYKFGWGLMNSRRAAQHISNSSGLLHIYEDTLNQGDSLLFHIYVDAPEEIKVTLCWTDPEGNPVTFQNDPIMLDNKTVMLVNDLDLRLIQRKTACEKLPYKLDPQTPDSAAKSLDNTVDNVESMSWKLPEKGWYTVNVRHKGTLQNGSQPFSLCVSGGEQGLVYDGVSWSPQTPDTSTSTKSILIMKGKTVSLPGSFKANNITVERDATLRFY